MWVRRHLKVLISLSRQKTEDAAILVELVVKLYDIDFYDRH